MKHKFFVCKKYFNKIVQHLQRSLKLQDREMCYLFAWILLFPLHLIIPKTCPMLCKKSPLENGEDNGDSEKGNEEFAEESNECSENDLGNQLNKGIDWYEVLQSYKSQPKSGDVMGRGMYESNIEEYVLQEIEEEFIDNNNEDFGYNDNVSDINNDNMDMNDIDTLKTNEAPFGNEQPGNVDVIAKNENAKDGNSMILYAPLSSYEFHQIFTNEEFFMIKLCHICDQANVPHHIFDDVIELLRECLVKDMKI